MDTIVYRDLLAEELDQIQPLWEKLNRHHFEGATDFKADFAKMTFADRKRKICSGKKAIKITGAQGIAADSPVIGYCIASITEEGTGEIDSIYIEEKYRGMGIGKELMRQSLKWFDENAINDISIAVAVGNEAVLPFYAQFGFAPRTCILKQKPV